jgi:hypothetical protein
VQKGSLTAIDETAKFFLPNLSKNGGFMIAEKSSVMWYG